MELLGTIEPAAGDAMHRDGWIALIGSHPSLAPVQPRQGINPFTKLPDIYQAATDSAIVLPDDAKEGAIHWAMDDSHRLVVWPLPMARARVVAVAEDVASRLGGRFHAGHDD
jgi:hypothetical protein